jgi:hypothetical protein
MWKSRKICGKLVTIVVASLLLCRTLAGQTEAPATPGSVVAGSAAEAERLWPLNKTNWVRNLVAADQLLPRIQPYEVEHEGTPNTVDEAAFDVARYDSPLAYARASDLATRAGLDGLAGKRVLDFG